MLPQKKKKSQKCNIIPYSFAAFFRPNGAILTYGFNGAFWGISLKHSFYLLGSARHFWKHVASHSVEIITYYLTGVLSILVLKPDVVCNMLWVFGMAGKRFSGLLAGSVSSKSSASFSVITPPNCSASTIVTARR